MMTDRVGEVQELHRFPVKSMAAESLQSVSVSWHGLAGDRRWAFIRPASERSGFPWFTIREKPELWKYQPRFLEPGNVESSKIVVATPDEDELEVADPELARRLGEGVRVIKQYGGVFDTFPLSLLTMQSVTGLSGLVGEPLSPLRFRPNILINTDQSDAFQEDGWAGAILRIGTVRFRLDKRDKRCMMVNIDPSNAASGPDVLREIVKERGAHFGMYGTTVEPGELAVGDPVFLER